MVINTAHRFIFIHVPKAAGTSVAAALSGLDGNHTGWLARTKHETSTEFFAAFPSRQSTRDHEMGLNPASYFCCAFVRHPWSRIASLYRYLVERRPRSEIDRVDSFKHFITLARDQEPWIKGLHTMRQQVDYFTTHCGMIELDFLGHYEHLADDLQSLGQRLGQVLSIPHLNRSSNSNLDYRRLYDAETIGAVRRMFADDIRHFGYEFETTKPSRRVSGPLSRPR